MDGWVLSGSKNQLVWIYFKNITLKKNKEKKKKGVQEDFRLGDGEGPPPPTEGSI